MDNVVTLPTAHKSPLLGPFVQHSIVVENRLIPLLTGAPAGADSTSITVDGRFSVSVPNELAYQVAWLLAQAIAVASGYSHLGAETKESAFAPKVGEITF